MLIALEINEINLFLIQKYIDEGYLPNFKKLINKYGYRITISETQYENIEPWIQWVTVHTGKDYKEHNVFRLGEITKTDLSQIWEYLEMEGYSVSAISPINGVNRTKKSPFFIPDPWTQTETSGNRLIKEFHSAIKQLVNDNSSNKLTIKSSILLIASLFQFAQIKNYSLYIKYIIGSKRNKWYRACFLDLLLSDIFISLQKKYKTDYSSLFLNGGAHIQHHYMLSSKYFPSQDQNPEWYVYQGADPIKCVFELYDRVLGDVINHFPDSRIHIITGLRQEPFEGAKYYWRLKNHQIFLDKIGLKYLEVIPRMSRDFTIKFQSINDAITAKAKLDYATVNGDNQLFSTSISEDLIYVELIYDKELNENDFIKIDNQSYDNFKNDVSFVAIKNGKHNGEGFFVDTGDIAEHGTKVYLKSIFEKTIEIVTGK